MAKTYVGIDLGGTMIKGAIATRSGKVLKEASIPTLSHEGPAGVLNRIGGLVNDLAAATKSRPVAVGMGVPGLADLKLGVTRFLPNLHTQWRNVKVRAALQPKIGCPVYLLNDVRCATLGELTFGHGRNANTMVFYALGTGVGGGIVVDGKLRLGPLGAAGEIGHMTVLPDGPYCSCGSRGCVEMFVSAPAMTAEGVRLLLSGQAPKLHAMVGGDAGKVSTKTMAAAAKAGDRKVAQVLVRAAEFLGLGASAVVTTLHPDLIVIGGGAAGIGDLLFKTVRRVIGERVKMFPTDDIRIEPSLLGDRAGVMGAIALAIKDGRVG